MIVSIFLRAVFSSDLTWPRRTSCAKHRHLTIFPKIGGENTNVQVHTEKVFRAIFDAVLNLEGISEVLQLMVGRNEDHRLQSLYHALSHGLQHT